MATLALVLTSIAAAAAIAHYAGLISIWPARGRGALSDDASFGSGSQALGSAGSLSLSGEGCSLAAPCTPHMDHLQRALCIVGEDVALDLHSPLHCMRRLPGRGAAEPSGHTVALSQSMHDLLASRMPQVQEGVPFSR